MNILDKFRRGFPQKAKNENSLEISRRVTDLVAVETENGDLSAIPHELEKLLPSNIEREAFVFGPETAKPFLFAIIVCTALTIAFAFALFIGGSTLAFTNHFAGLSIAMTGISTVIILGNILCVVYSIKQIKFSLRYKKYREYFQFHSIEAIDNLALYTGRSTMQIAKDLRKAISRDYIPQGHFGRNDFLFMVSDDIYRSYQEKPAVFDHYYMLRIEERERMRGQNPEIQRILDMGKGYVARIHDSNDLIQDKAVTEELNRMEKTISAIFKEVDINPQQAEKLGLFLNYYLPTTDKLLTTYIDFTEKVVTNRILAEAKKKLEESLESINVAFENILERFYMEQEADVLSEIEALQMTMSNEGLLQAEESVKD